MPTGSSSVSLNATEREWPAFSNTFTNSPSGISCWTAMICARGTITSSIRRSRSPRIFLSIVPSSGEKPRSLGSAVLQNLLQIGACRSGAPAEESCAASARKRSRRRRASGLTGPAMVAGRLLRTLRARPTVAWPLPRYRAWLCSVSPRRSGPHRDRRCRGSPECCVSRCSIRSASASVSWSNPIR